MMITTITLLLPTRPLQEAGAEEATGVDTATPPTTTAMMTTMTTTAMTITTTAAATKTPITATKTSSPRAEGAAAAGAPVAELHRLEDAAAPARRGAGPASPRMEGLDRAAEGGEREEACSREGEEGYVVFGVAAVEM